MQRKVSARKPEPERIAVTEVRERLTELMNRARYANETIIITSHGDDVAAIVGVARAIDAA